MAELRMIVAFVASMFVASAANGLHAPRSFRDCANCPEMVVVPAGRFLMGSPAHEKGRNEIEGPQHSVTIRRFAAGRYDITRGQWRSFVRATHRTTVNGCQWVGPTHDNEKTANWQKLDFEQNDRHPVVCVTWQDAKDYTKWLSARTAHHYRLLSEAEWEYAARGGTESAYQWPSGVTHELANYGLPKCCGGVVEGRDRWMFTSPVGAFPPNHFGLFDMAGNVLQLVEDCFAPAYDPNLSDGSPNRTPVRLSTSGDLADLNGASSCDYRIVRGGDWGDQAAWIRTAARNFAPPPGDKLESYRSGGFGFRVARDLP